MPRGRSKSIVQKIASDVPSFKEDHLNLGKEPTAYRLSRSRSLSSLGLGARSPSNTSTETLFPLSSREKDAVWTNYIDTFNYDCLLDAKDIETVNQLDTLHFLNFKDNCNINKHQLQTFINETDVLLGSINKLTLKYDQISHETSDFDTESTKLLNLQVEYTNKYDQIERYLRHFERLESITKHLSKLGYNLVVQRREFFSDDILRQLDESIEFFTQHSDFKDIELYQSRFRQCMTRALTLIKSYLVAELNKINDDLLKSLNQETAVSIDLLIYNEFNNYLQYNPQFNELNQEIVSRIANHNEYIGLENDVLAKYFKIRLHLIDTYLNKNSTLKKLQTSATTSLVQSCQDQISFFTKIVEREFALFKKFFVVDSIPSFLNPELYQYFRGILDPLYDSLRHHILRETNITSLCQLTALLQKYYEFEEEEKLDLVDFGRLFEPILHDVQTRLIFRIQIYVDDKLMKYTPRPEDLRIGRRKSSIDHEVNVLDVDYPDNLFKDVYLPLGKALTLLSDIYELINSVVFDDLAHYIVHACIILLKGEFYKLSLAHLGLIDTKLNYLQNLIILKGQINSFDIQFTRNDYSIDFTGGLSDIWHVLRNGEFSFDNNGFFELAKKTVPRIIDNMIDANYEIELELNNAVTEFVQESTNTISEPIIGKDQSQALEVSMAFKDNLIVKLPGIYKQIRIFIKDENVVKFLMDSISNLILVAYENFYKNLTNLDNADEETRAKLDEIMEVDTLFGFVSDLISGLYEQDENLGQVTFNEEILNDLEQEQRRASVQ